MKVYVVTTAWGATEESEDFSDAHPIQTLQVFGTYPKAREHALEQVSENNLHYDEDDPTPDPDDPNHRGAIEKGVDSWEIRNDYETVYIDIRTEDVG